MHSKTFLQEAVRYVLTGFTNTAIDLLVLNCLIFVLGTGTSSLRYSVFKMISFLAAVTNSYFMNRYWVFKKARSSIEKNREKTVWQERIVFVLISGMGFALNVTVSSFFFSSFIDVYPSHVSLVANMGAILGTGVTLVWNFLGYKFLVFAPKRV